jgi:hypothetical protein
MVHVRNVKKKVKRKFATYSKLKILNPNLLIKKHFIEAKPRYNVELEISRVRQNATNYN